MVPELNNCHPVRRFPIEELASANHCEGLPATFACQHDDHEAAGGADCGGMPIPYQYATDNMEEVAATFPSHFII